jgi:hypothetical protein
MFEDPFLIFAICILVIVGAALPLRPRATHKKEIEKTKTSLE